LFEIYTTLLNVEHYIFCEMCSDKRICVSKQDLPSRSWIFSWIRIQTFPSMNADVADNRTAKQG